VRDDLTNDTKIAKKCSADLKLSVFDEWRLEKPLQPAIDASSWLNTFVFSLIQCIDSSNSSCESWCLATTLEKLWLSTFRIWLKRELCGSLTTLWIQTLEKSVLYVWIWNWYLKYVELSSGDLHMKQSTIGSEAVLLDVSHNLRIWWTVSLFEFELFFEIYVLDLSCHIYNRGNLDS
jgi:hypothetical protein